MRNYKLSSTPRINRCWEIGDRVGKWTLRRRVSGKHPGLWLLICDCGTQLIGHPAGYQSKMNKSGVEACCLRCSDKRRRVTRSVAIEQAGAVCVPLPPETPGDAINSL